MTHTRTSIIMGITATPNGMAGQEVQSGGHIPKLIATAGILIKKEQINNVGHQRFPDGFYVSIIG